MDRITEFTITRIKMQGFKAFAQEREFFFRSTSYISGANGQGKTTIADAIAYAFCGVPFWGEKGIDKLMSKGAKQMCVEVEFVNGDGEIYTLVRRKNGNTTSIALNGNTMTQKSLTALFVEKDIFLSVINPLYFIEKIASDGREFLQKLLPPVSKEAILAVCSEQTRDLLENESLLEPEYYIKNKRAEMKEADDQITYLSGQLALLEEQLENNSVKRNKLETSVKEQKAKISAVMKKQFEGIDVEAVRQEYNEAKKSLSNDEILALERKRMEIQNRPYVSKFSAQRAKIEAELNAARLEYTGLYNKATGIRPGVPCPTCTHALTNEEFNAVRKDITATLANMKKNGANLNSQLDDIVKLDAQAKDQFEQYKADDLKKVEEEIKTMPNYFADYDTTVHFISEEELKANHSGIPHGGFVLRSGVTGWNKENKHIIEYSLKLDSNPEFTSSVLIAYARAAHRLANEGASGCKTVFDIAPAYLVNKTGEELRASML